MSEYKISKIMKQQGLVAIYRNKRISNVHTSLNTSEYRPDNKLNNLNLNQRDQEIWSIDFTEEKIKNKKVYICALISINTRMIVGHTISFKNNSQIAVNTVLSAISKYEAPYMISSDRGSPFISKLYNDTMKELGIIQSMSRPRKAVDNRYIETFFKSMKTELGKTNHLKVEDYIKIVNYWIYYYNTKRIHSSLGYITPLNKYIKSLNDSEERYKETRKILTESEFTSNSLSKV